MIINISIWEKNNLYFGGIKKINTARKNRKRIYWGLRVFLVLIEGFAIKQCQQYDIIVQKKNKRI